MTTDKTSQDTRQPSVGERLRKAREAAGYTVAEVADRQHLRPAVITAIENGDYRQVDSELFLKGYVRAYASQVGIDPDSVVRQLDRELEPLREERQARVEANPLVTIERRKRRKRQIARVVAVLVVAAALFYAGSLYLAHQQPATPEQVSEPGDGQPVVLDDAAEVQAPESQPDERDPIEDPEAFRPGPQEAPDENVAESEQRATGDDESGNRIGAGLKTEPGPVMGAEAGEPGTGGAQTPEPGAGAGEGEPDPDSEAAIVSEALEEPEAPATGGGDNRLIVEFSGDCWVEVQDRNGRTLVASLRSAGETLNVSGEPPLRVVLGAVNAVASVRYDGETVDLSDRRARNNRLVLTLSE